MWGFKLGGIRLHRTTSHKVESLPAKTLGGARFKLLNTFSKNWGGKKSLLTITLGGEKKGGESRYENFNNICKTYRGLKIAGSLFLEIGSNEAKDQKKKESGRWRKGMGSHSFVSQRR